MKLHAYEISIKGINIVTPAHTRAYTQVCEYTHADIHINTYKYAYMPEYMYAYYKLQASAHDVRQYFTLHANEYMLYTHAQNPMNLLQYLYKYTHTKIHWG